MNELLESAATRASRYLADIQERAVAPAGDAVARLDVLREPLPDGPSEPADVLALLDEVGSPATMAMAGPRFFGFVIGGSLPVALAANWLARRWDQNAGAATRRHRRASLDWRSSRCAGCVELFGLPAECRLAPSSQAPRWPTSAPWPPPAHARAARAGWNVEADGLFGAPPITVVVGEEAHPTVLKALGLLGLRARPHRARAGG